MTTAQRREEILALLNQADAPIAAKDLAARFGVSRQVIVQDLAVIRASRPNIISTNRGYILQQQETGCLREFKVRHTPEQAEQELNLIVDHGGRVKNISISHRVYGRVTAEMDIRSRQDVNEFVRRRLYLKPLPFIFLPFKNQCCPTHLIGKVFCRGPVNLINPFIF